MSLPKQPGSNDSSNKKPNIFVSSADSPWRPVVEVAGGTVLLGFGAAVALGVWAVGVVAVWPAIALGVVTVIYTLILLDAAEKAERTRVPILLAGAAALFAMVW